MSKTAENGKYLKNQMMNIFINTMNFLNKLDGDLQEEQEIILMDT